MGKKGRGRRGRVEGKVGKYGSREMRGGEM